MQCNICRKECADHEPMVLVRLNAEAISKATEREPLCLIDYAVCPDCVRGWSKAFVRRQTTPVIFLALIAAAFIVLGVTTKIGWGMIVASVIPLGLIALSLSGILRQARRSPEEQARMVFCDFFFQKGGIPKQIIAKMPNGKTVQDVRVASRGPNRYMLMNAAEMKQYLTAAERAGTRSWNL